MISTLLKLFMAALAVALIAGCGGSESPVVLKGAAAAGASASDTTGDGAKLVVNGTADEDARNDNLSLREAILLATGDLLPDALTKAERKQVTGSPGAGASDTITFDPGVFAKADPATISLASPLPSLHTGRDIVDGGGGVIVQGLSRVNAFMVESTGNVIAGLQITKLDTAVVISYDATQNTIGRFGDRRGNVLSGNYVGIEIRGRRNAVRGNLIGTDAAGTGDMGNRAEGIWIAPGATENLIGGTTEKQRNVISANLLFGISIDGSGATGNLVIGNYIGVDISGEKALGNKYGITIQAGAQDNVVGGGGDKNINVIAANNTGVLVRGKETQRNTVTGNYIAVYPWDGEWIKNVKDVWITDDASANIVEKNDKLVLPPPGTE